MKNPCFLGDLFFVHFSAMQNNVRKYFVVKKFPDMPCMKRVYRDEKAFFHWSAARNKERFSPR